MAMPNEKQLLGADNQNGMGQQKVEEPEQAVSNESKREGKAPLNTAMEYATEQCTANSEVMWRLERHS